LCQILRIFLTERQTAARNAKARNVGGGGSDSDDSVPMSMNPTDMQRFFAQELQIGEEMLSAVMCEIVYLLFFKNFKRFKLTSHFSHIGNRVGRPSATGRASHGECNCRVWSAHAHSSNHETNTAGRRV
jgi:hypothetical protein